jgi:putative ABC transport system permease protein
MRPDNQCPENRMRWRDRIDEARAELRVAVRRVARTPGFSTAAILIIALGVGLATAVFTVADAVLIRRLPVVDQDRIVVLQGETPDRQTDNVPLDAEHARDYARSTTSLARTAFFLYNGAAPVTVRDGERISSMQEALVTGDYFDVLGARPLVGRALRGEDDRFGAPRVAVISHRAWQERFGGSPDVIGRRIFILEYDATYSIVGVMPAGLDFPRGTDAWVAVHAAIPDSAMKFLDFDVIGRLAPHASPEAARLEMTAYFSRHYDAAGMRRVQGVVHLLPTFVIGDTRPAVLAFAAAAALLLLITCINVANLLLVRGLGRVREVAVRTALGASRARIVRQLVAEHGMFAVGGGVFGVLLAVGAIRLFVVLAPPALPRLDEIHVAPSTVAVACGITALATILFALAPAVLTSRVDALVALRSGVRHSATSRSRSLGDALVVGQVALAVVVLSAAGLLGRSLVKLQTVDLAFRPSRVTVMELVFRPTANVQTTAQAASVLQRLMTAIEGIPGVEATSPVVSVPYASMRSWEGRPSIEGQSEAEAARNPMVDIEVVSPNFFTTLGLPIVRGRAFSDADREGAAPVTIVSESIARRFWPGADPIGKHVVGGAKTPLTVVGVVPDTRYRDLRTPHAVIYYPLRQSEFPFPPTTLLIRAHRSRADLAAQLRRIVEESTPEFALASVTPFEQLLAGPLAQPRMNAVLLAVFAGAALLLAAVGLFSVLATRVRQRRYELGVRMALGATSTDVARLVVRRGALLAGAGASAGLVMALVLDRFIQALLFEVSPWDAPTLGAACAVLVAVALVAAYVPARRAAQVDPMIALRTD